MSMIGGSVTVNQLTGFATGTGLAKVLYDAELAITTFPTTPILGSTNPPWSPQKPVSTTDINIFTKGVIQIKNDIAKRANALGPALVSYLQANAKAVITTSTIAGRTPNPNNANTNIQPPTSNVELGII